MSNKLTGGADSTGLIVFQANVGRGGSNHEIALNLAYESGAHLVALQEPWVHEDLSRRTTKRHPGFETFCPADRWDSRPRVLTFVRKHVGLQVDQIWCGVTRDVLAIQIHGQRLSPFSFWNVYNAPPGCEGGGDGVHLLTEKNTSGRTITVGDFNLRHPLWDHTGHTRPSGSTLDFFIAWLEARGASIINPPGVATHAT